MFRAPNKSVVIPENDKVVDLKMFIFSRWTTHQFYSFECDRESLIFIFALVLYTIGTENYERKEC